MGGDQQSVSSGVGFIWWPETQVSARSHLLATNYKADTCESPGEGVDQTLTCVNTGFSCYLLPHSQPQTPNSDGFIWSEDVDLALVLRSPTYRQSKHGSKPLCAAVDWYSDRLEPLHWSHMFEWRVDAGLFKCVEKRIGFVSRGAFVLCVEVERPSRWLQPLHVRHEGRGCFFWHNSQKIIYW